MSQRSGVQFQMKGWWTGRMEVIFRKWKISLNSQDQFAH